MKSLENLEYLKKCEHCQQWTDGNKAFCGHCGEILDKKYREERAELEREQQEQSPMMRFVKLKKAENSPFWKWVETMIRSGQMVIVFLIAFITVILALLPG